VKEFVDRVNGYVTEQEPWSLAKDEANAARLDVVLVTICESLRGIAVLYNPLMPRAMSSLWEQLGAEAVLGPISEQRISDVPRWGQLPAGTQVTKGDSLFPRIEEAS
jgi:methionyl-tRNA synthetase